MYGLGAKLIGQLNKKNTRLYELTIILKELWLERKGTTIGLRRQISNVKSLFSQIKINYLLFSNSMLKQEGGIVVQTDWKELFEPSFVSLNFSNSFSE